MRRLEAELSRGEPLLGGAPAVVVRGLRKTYGGVEAVRGIDVRIGHGEIFAFLGPNGAGKTTAAEILEGFRERTGARSRCVGHRSRARHSRVA